MKVSDATLRFGRARAHMLGIGQQGKPQESVPRREMVAIPAGLLQDRANDTIGSDDLLQACQQVLAEKPASSRELAQALFGLHVTEYQVRRVSCVLTRHQHRVGIRTHRVKRPDRKNTVLIWYLSEPYKTSPLRAHAAEFAALHRELADIKRTLEVLACELGRRYYLPPQD